MPFHAIDLSAARTYPSARAGLVAHDAAPPPCANLGLAELAERIATARLAGRPVICSLGAHAVKRGLTPLLIDLMERGVITHLAADGAAASHDFAIALLGHTDEDVDEEAATLMNGAIRGGARDGLGLGEALGRLLSENVPRRERSLLAAAYRLRLPYTVHVAIGADIIQQHPACDFAALGWATGRDFAIYTTSVSRLEGGVLCNIGPMLSGLDVFLQALAIARSLGHTVRAFTKTDFDLAPLAGDYCATITALAAAVRQRLGDAPLPAAPLQRRDAAPAAGELSPLAARELARLLEGAPALAPLAEPLAQAFRALRLCFRAGGTLFICGNGGSMADALHIAGELDKSFRLPRPMPPHLQQRLAALPGGAALAAHLQQGLRTIAIGANQALASAIENDSPERAMAFAQELYALARPGDALLAISTSGHAQNAINAATVARALGLTVIALTGAVDSPLAAAADVALRAPSRDTPEVQGYHQQLYHALCLMLEADAFGG